MEQQRFEQLTQNLPKTSRRVTVEVSELKKKSGRNAPKSPETRAKISAALKGKPKSQETRAKMSAAHKGREPGNKGVKGKQVPWNKGKAGTYKLPRKKKAPTLYERVLGYLKGFLKRLRK